MQRLHRLAKLWDWLPAFRTVAETEHLRLAARVLEMSPSALSRTIKLLEKEYGEALFRRTGRTLELTDEGQELLDVTREAMRIVDDGLSPASSVLKGPLRVSSAGRLTLVYLLPVICRLMREHPQLEPHVVGFKAGEVVPALLRGDIDAALTYQPVPHKSVAVELLGQATNGVYCGVGHPLHDRANVVVDDIVKHAFAAPEPQPGAASFDGWPVEITRRVVLFSSLLDPGLFTCQAGQLLAVFPDDLVRTLGTLGPGAPLRRLPVEIVPPTRIYGMRRRPISSKIKPATILLREVGAGFERRNKSPDLAADPSVFFLK